MAQLRIALCILIFLLFPVSAILAQSLQEADEKLFLEIHGWKSNRNQVFFSAFSSSVVPATITIPGAISLVKLLRKDSLPLSEAVTITGSAALGFGLSQGLKYAFKRQRPWQGIPGVDPVQPVSDRWSMPSGHTSTAFATATALCLEFPRWEVITPSLLWAGSVGVSRIVLGHHYPGDVLAGAALGAGSAWLTRHLQNFLIKRRKHQPEKTIPNSRVN